jgi:hypothetical protein
VSTVVLTHINQFGSFRDATECGFNYGFRCADKGNHGAIRGLPGIYIEELNTFGLAPEGYRLGYGVNYFMITSLAKVGDTFDNSIFHG